MGMKLNPIRATCMYRRYAYAYRDDHTRMEPVCLRTGRIPGGHSWGICDGAHCPYAGIQVTGNNATMYSSQGEEIGTCRCIETTFVLEPEEQKILQQSRTDPGRQGKHVTGKVKVVDRKNEKELLKQYLGRYYNSRRKKAQLERRLKAILEEMNAPIGGIRYSPVNRRTESAGAGAASFVYRMGEIETRIGRQKKVIEKDLLKVMDIMDFLEENSLERMILELRFIDCKSWKTIEKEMHLSRRACFNYQDKALETLLDFRKVQHVLEEYGEGQSG